MHQKSLKFCHYWYFKDIGFKYEPYLCNGCHDLMQKAFSFNDVANAYIKRSAYRIRFIIINRAKYYYENDKKKD